MHRIAAVAVLGVAGAMAGVGTAAAGGGGHCAPDEAEGSRIELIDACFTPSTLLAEPGETITFVNRDGFEHNVSGTGWGHYEDMSQGDRFTASFEDVGIYPFACTLHPGMNGVIVVGGGSGATTLADAAPPSSQGPAERAGSMSAVAAGAVGLLVGAAAGAGLTMVRRRSAVEASVA
jgi:plastocyanin